MVISTGLLLALLGLGAAGVGLDGLDKMWDQNSLNDNVKFMDSQLQNDDSWNGLTLPEKEALLAKYRYDNFLGFGSGYNRDAFTDDYNAFLAARENMTAERPVAEDFLARAREGIAAQDAESLRQLDALRAGRIDSYNSELAGLSSSYDQARSSLLSQQYQQNARAMDTLSSQMERSRRNALEAGASAGLRLAGNINTLLSNQNAQSQQSLDTANQLAQMMVNQRNAEASVRDRYQDYMSQDFTQRQNIQNSAESRAQQRFQNDYGAASESYSQKVADWDQRYSSNPFWNSSLRTKPKY